MSTTDSSPTDPSPTDPSPTDPSPTDPSPTDVSPADVSPADVSTAGLTILGRTVRAPVAHVECFPAPDDVSTVRFTTDELSSICPVTQQPDLSHVVIEYEPGERCVESKSLKLYLWSFRDRAVFAEALAAEIAREIMATAEPARVTVTLTQRPRGGIEVQAVADLKR